VARGGDGSNVNLDAAETWRWIWLVTATAMIVAEVVTPAAFVFLPFAAGAFVAALLAFAGASVAVEWSVFAGLSLVTFAGLWPLGRRLERTAGGGVLPGVGANRLIGKQALVLETIGGPAHATGLVQVEREKWPAESLSGDAIAAGSVALVARVDGTRLVVSLLELPPHIPEEPGDQPPGRS
jgi:membrane protein implicated in regulation of membrane protease activity